MGFGSYDESEQEQPGENDGPEGEDVTSDIKGENHHDGEDSVVDESVEDMMGHL